MDSNWAIKAHFKFVLAMVFVNAIKMCNTSSFNNAGLRDSKVGPRFYDGSHWNKHGT